MSIVDKDLNSLFTLIAFEKTIFMSINLKALGVFSKHMIQPPLDGFELFWINFTYE